jgi:hypothetical protein
MSSIFAPAGSRGIFLETLSFEELEQVRVNHSVLLLQDAAESYSPEYRQAILEHVYNLEASHISEVLVGETRTQFEFVAHEGKLYAPQPQGETDWQKLHENGVRRARLRAQRDSRFTFYARIAEAELEEAKVQEAMVRKGEPSTLLTVSLCGNDVASSDNLRLIGRDPELQRGYLRASVYDGEKLHLYSYSKDGLTLEGARKILHDLGVSVEPDANSIDILKEQVHIPGAHHDLLTKIAPLEGTDCYKFVLEQDDLLDRHLAGLSDLASSNLPPNVIAEHTNNLRYDTMSSFKQLLAGSWVDLGNLDDSVAYAGSVERSLGTEFPGCDTIVTANQNNSVAEAGYVNAYDRLKSRWSWKDGFCQVKECPTQKPKRQKVKVGPCSVCKNCQAMFDNNKDPVKENKKLQKKTKPRVGLW